MASNAPARPWKLTGDYFENCNCEIACPCEVSAKPALTSQPTNGACEVVMGFHVDHGSYGDTRIDGLNAALATRSPGIMGEGNWSVALYIDERANEAQREALTAIFSGAAGGPIALFAPFIKSFLGVRPVPMTWRQADGTRSVEIPGTLHLSVHGLPGFTPGTVISANNIHPFAHELFYAMGDDGSTYDGDGMHFDNSGKNGHYAAIDWAGPQ